MSNLFTAVSVEQQEIVAGGRRRRLRPARPFIVVSPTIKTANITTVQIAGNDLNGRGRGNSNQSNRQDAYTAVSQ